MLIELEAMHIDGIARAVSYRIDGNGISISLPDSELEHCSTTELATLDLSLGHHRLVLPVPVGAVWQSSRGPIGIGAWATLAQMTSLSHEQPARVRVVMPDGTEFVDARAPYAIDGRYVQL